MPTRPVDLYTTNHFYFEIPGLISPQFHTVEGIELESGDVTIVDGSTNIQHAFSSQLKRYNDIVLVRSYDGTVDDQAMRTLVNACINEGYSFDGALVKQHFGEEVFRVLFLGMRIKRVQYPTMQTDAEEKLDVRYTCFCL
jgi:hypothetical protein